MMKELLFYVAAKIDANDIGLPDTDSNVVFANILNIIYFVAGLVAVIVIIVSGLMMSVQGNDPGKIAQRKNMITYSVIGLVVVTLAFTITQFVQGRF